MEDNNPYFELTKMIDDKNTMENDLSQMFSSLRETLQKRYVSRLHSVVNQQQRLVKTNPPREVTLMRALKAFVPPQNQANIDGMIDTMMMLHTAQQMQSELYQLASSSEKNLTAAESGALTPVQNTASVQSSAQVSSLLLTLALFNII